MTRSRVTTSQRVEERLRQGWAPGAIAAEARRKGEPCPSLSTLHRRSREVNGAKAVSPGRGAKKPAAPPEQRLVSARRRAPAGPVSAPAPPPAPPSQPGTDEPEVIDFANADLATLDAWIAKAQALLAKAEADENVAGFASISRLLLAAFKARAALRPPPPPDPNANPDMLAAADRARAKLHELVDRALEARGA